ncbi:MAG: complex I NDUFA9 subunit family protein [Rhodospirillaceae bacterium]|nr:complex I NDUFA9 subunit family protein [Rhodospirillaceae bacterium]
MTQKLAVVFGGSGFIGRYVVRQLAAAGWRVRIAVRDTRKAQFLKPAGDLGQISFIPASVTDPVSVAAAVHGADAVINLVGVLFDVGKRSFKAMHVTGAANVAQAAMIAGAKTLIHMSALGADAKSETAYARSKAEGEAAVRSAFPNATIFRPSVVFGPEDSFFNLYGLVAQVSPFLPFFTNANPHAPEGGGSKFQLVYVGDVATAIVQAVTDARHAGKTYELGGGRVYTMRDVVQIVNRETMRNRKIIGLPYIFALPGAYIGAAVRSLMALVGLPVDLLMFPTTDQLKLLKAGSVLTGNLPGLEAFGIEPTVAETVVPMYLKRFRAIQQNKKLRVAAR